MGIHRMAGLHYQDCLEYPAILDHLKRQGYTGICLSISDPSQDTLIAGIGVQRAREIAEMAAERGMRVAILTGYMKYHEALLQDHPEWRMKLSSGEYSEWGCPFNEEYKRVYLNLLRDIASIEAVKEIYLNDEAYLGFDEASLGCYCDNCQELFKEKVGQYPPLKADWSSSLWREWISWRFEKWIEVHREMKKVVTETRSDIIVGFQSTPLVDLVNHNPWITGVDLAGMADVLDVLSCDAYHCSQRYLIPVPTYLSELTRFFVAAGNKPCTIVVLGNPSPVAPRMDEKDGYWMGILPVAVGARGTVTWTYERMACNTPVTEAFEESFKLDKYLSQAAPLRYAAVVHGFQSEVWRHNQPSIEPWPGWNPVDTYDARYFRRMCEVLRHTGVPYSHLWDKRLTLENLDGYRAVILPQISCLSRDQMETLQSYADGGGGVVAIGQYGLYDEKGENREDVDNLQTLGVEIGEALLDGPFRIRPLEDHPIFGDGAADLPILENAIEIKSLCGGKSIATLVDMNGEETGLSGMVIMEKGGRRVYIPGEVKLLHRNPGEHWPRRSTSPKLIANAVYWTAKGLPCLRIENFPPMTCLRRVATNDPRIIPTVELFPMVADGFYLAIIASYMGEEMTVKLAVDVRDGQTLTSVQDILTQESYDFHTAENGSLLIQVRLKPKDAVKPLLIRWS